jgi:hypothetical protein
MIVPDDDPAPLEAMRQGYGRLLGLAAASTSEFKEPSWHSIGPAVTTPSVTSAVLQFGQRGPGDSGLDSGALSPATSRPS